MTILVGFSRNNKVLSRLICKMTKSTVSHAYIRLPELGIVIHAHGWNVNCVAYENFVKQHQIVKEIEVQEVQQWDWLILQLGKPYGLFTLLGFIWVLVWGKKNPFSDSDYSYICSELVARALNIEGAENTTPQELMEKLDER